MRGWEVLADAAGVLGGLAIFAMMAVIALDVGGRYFLDAPTAWALEITSYLMLASVFLGAAHTLKAGGHINVDVAVRRLSPGLRHGARVLTLSMVVVFSVVVAWQGVQQMRYLVRTGLASLQLEAPLSIPYALVPLGAALLGLQAVVEIAKAVTARREERRRPPGPA